MPYIYRHSVANSWAYVFNFDHQQSHTLIVAFGFLELNAVFPAVGVKFGVINDVLFTIISDHFDSILNSCGDLHLAAIGDAEWF